jgi:hypothetical protein
VSTDDKRGEGPDGIGPPHAQDASVTLGASPSGPPHGEQSETSEPFSRERLLAWQKVEEILRADYCDADALAVRVVCAAVAAHRITDFPPAWIMAVAPSGSLKTVVLESLAGLPSVHFVDEVTPQTFLSGKIDKPRAKRKRPASYLLRIGHEGILVACDFSTYLSMDRRAQGRILSQLRRIYDGHFTREFGSDESPGESEWRGRITMLAGVTPDIDSHYAVFRSLGERFTQVRWPRPDGIGSAMAAMEQTRDTAERLRQAIQRLLGPILSVVPKMPAPFVSPDFERRISHLSELIAIGRTHVPRDRYSREVSAMPCPEGNTRLPQELAQLARGSALLAGRGTVSEPDFAVMRRAAMDCLPMLRRTVLAAAFAGRSPYACGLAPVLTQRVVEDLETLGLLQRSGDENGLTLKSMESIERAGITSYFPAKCSG